MSKLWYEKYRPVKLADYVFQNREMKDTVEAFVREKRIPNLLLSGVQGTGKSTLARVLINELGIQDIDVLRINASNESGIDVIREKIVGFVETLSFGNSIKVVLMEEADRLSKAAQEALRDVTESYSDTARFVFTCNYPNKIIAPLHSRFQHLHVDSFDKNGLLERIAFILESEGIKIDNIDFVLNHINAHAPDLRKIINSIEQASKTGTLRDVSGSGGSDDAVEKWKAMWVNGPNQVGLESMVPYVDNTNFDEMMRIAYLNAHRVPDNKKDKCIVLCAAYLDKATRVADLQMMMHAFIIHLFSNLN